MTAKVPLKVHLRLRFQNLRKAPHCGALWAGCGRCDCGLYLVLLSNGLHLSKNFPVKFGFSPKPIPANIAKKLPPQRCSKLLFIAVFQLLPQTAHICFHSRKWVHTRLSEKDRTQRLTRRNRWRFGWGVVSLPSERSTRFGNPAWPDVGTANFAAFGSWPGVLPKNAESLRSSDALMRVAVPKASRPAGLRDLFRFCRNCGLYALRSGPFRVCEARGGITTLSALYVLLKRRTAACQNDLFAVF